MVTLVGGKGVKGSGSFHGQGFHVAFERSDPGPYEAMRDEGVAIRGASVEAVVKTTRQVKELIRDYIDAHFTGSEFHGNGRRRVSNASAQERFYDELEEKGQYSGLVYSKFGKRDKGGFVDYLLLHVRGGTLRPKTGEWLRIPNRGQGGGPRPQSGFYPMSASDIFFTRSPDGRKLFQLRRYRKGSIGEQTRGAVQLLATLVKSVLFPATLSGVEAIARQRPELFEGHFAEALKVRRQANRGAS